MPENNQQEQRSDLADLRRFGCWLVLAVAAVFVVMFILFVVWEVHTCAPMGCGGDLPMGPTYLLPT